MPPYGTPQPYNPYRLPTTPPFSSSGDVSLWRSLSPSPAPQAPRRTATPAPSEIRAQTGGGIPIASLPSSGGIPISSLPTATPSGGIPISSLPSTASAPPSNDSGARRPAPPSSGDSGLWKPRSTPNVTETIHAQSTTPQVSAPKTPAQAADQTTGGGGGEAGTPFSPQMFEPGSVLNWSDREVADITEATVGRALSKQEFMNWIDAFTREHGQTPWQTGPFDAANNLLDHLIAMGDSERQAGQGKTVNWEGLYYNRYAAPTYTPGYKANTDKDQWQRLVPGQMPTPYQPWWLMQGAMGNPDWYMNIRRPYYGG